MKYQFFYVDFFCAILCLFMAALPSFAGGNLVNPASAFLLLASAMMFFQAGFKVKSNLNLSREVELIVNDAAKPDTKNADLQHLYMRVNSEEIRMEVHNGRDHWVIPSYTLPDNVVMNGGLYTRDQIDKHYMQLNGTLAPLGHPKIDGKHVSAFSPEAIHANHVGAFNRNVERRGNRIYMEKWLDVNYAKQSEGGRRVLEAIEQKKPIHTSVAVYAVRELTPNAAGYQWKANILAMDHDAILLDEPGAATPADGVGLFVNVADAKELTVNAGVLSSDSYGARMKLLSESAADHFQSKDWRAWVEDFDTVHAIVHVDNDTHMYSYAIVDGAVVWGTDGKKVESKQTWYESNPVVNWLIKKINVNSVGDLFIKPQKPVETDDMPFSDEDKAAIKAMLSDHATAIQANTDAKIQSLTEALTVLQANNADILARVSENKNKEETEMRKVVSEKLGEVVANALKDDALVEAFKKLQPEGQVIVNGKVTDNTVPSIPDPKTYFPQ